VRGLPIGWRQRLALAAAIVHRPSLLFLDEPTSGVDPLARRNFWDLIYNMADEGATIFVTTHYMDEAEHCGRVGFMRRGKLLEVGSPNVLKRSVISGEVWEVSADPLVLALETLAGLESVARVGLAGDHLRVVTRPGTRLEDLEQTLISHGVGFRGATRTEPGLEDVFIFLASDDPGS
jgi:ABC-2 type transport system ATP-binding protein